MSARGLTAALALGLAAGALGACNAAPPPDQPGSMEPDTARGTVRIVGADPATMVVLVADGDRLTLRGPTSDELRRVNGLGVTVRGTRADGAMTVTAFRVREADGLPAADGVLEIDGDTAILVTADGRRLRYRPVPSALRDRAGARVWIAGEPGGEPQAWGIITQGRGE